MSYWMEYYILLSYYSYSLEDACGNLLGVISSGRLLNMFLGDSEQGFIL